MLRVDLGQLKTKKTGAKGFFISLGSGCLSVSKLGCKVRAARVCAVWLKRHKRALVYLGLFC